MSSITIFCLGFTAVKVDVTWLDEIAEGLKLVLSALNSAIIALQRLRVSETEYLHMDENTLTVYFKNAMRQMTYTLGYVASRLI